MRLWAVILIGGLLSSCEGRAYGQTARVETVRLEIDEHACTASGASMDLELVVTSDTGESRHSLHPSCRYSFSQDIELAGVRCHVESEMCSRFARSAQMEARCQGGADSTATANRTFECARPARTGRPR